MRNFFKSALVLVSVALFAVSCSKDSEEREVASADGSLLSYIPADSPYVFGQLGALDDDVLDELEPAFDEVLAAYGDVIDAFLASDFEDQPDSEMDEEAAAKVRAVGGIISEMMSVEGLESAGIKRGDLSVLYGNGLLPVLRAQISDQAAMEDLLARIEKEMEAEMSTDEIDGISYKYLGDEGRLIIAFVHEQMVITLIPEDASDDLLRSQLGLTKPDRSMADSGELQALAEKYDYLEAGLMLIDMTRMADIFVSEPNAANAEVLELAEYDASELDDVCKAEIKEVARIMPRMVAGLRNFDTEKLGVHMIMEMREDLAAGMSQLVAPVQGMGLVPGNLFSFGMSLDLAATREFYIARLDALAEDPFDCELFAETQAELEQTRASLNQPLPPIVYSIKGFFAVVDGMEGMDAANQVPPTSVDASLLVSAENPQGLVAMGAMFSPELAAMNLQPDGNPAALDLPPGTPMAEDAFVAMTDASLALSVGEDSESRLSALMESDFATPSPFMTINMDSNAYYNLVADSIEFGEPADGEEEMDPEVQKAMAAATRAIADLYKRESMVITFTDRGIEIAAESVFNLD